MHPHEYLTETIKMKDMDSSIIKLFWCYTDEVCNFYYSNLGVHFYYSFYASGLLVVHFPFQS